MWMRAVNSRSNRFISDPVLNLTSKHFARLYNVDGRDRLSAVWAPNAKERSIDFDRDGSHGLLLKAGYLFQAHAGIFHLLPLGLRVQEKIESLVDRHMRSIGASKLSLSSVSSESLWRQSGRLDNAELLRVKSRRSNATTQETDGLLLCPTHEEEITALAARTVHSHKALPMRLYQISRKYRDELRPRGGLLRTREFIMKDLYTFDGDNISAMQTYRLVLNAYKNLFEELKIPYLVAEADSGAMGGNHSHEFHFISPAGEDTLFACNIEGKPGCGYAANSEIVKRETHMESASSPSPNDEDSVHGTVHMEVGDQCPKCSKGQLAAYRAIELGHTFHLGTRYSAPLGAIVSKEQGESVENIALSMGCHGIGISRMIAAVAAVMANRSGLNWPRVLAPWEVIIVPGSKVSPGDTEKIYDVLRQHHSQQGHGSKLPTPTLMDAIIDDRHNSMISKLKDADLVGYPVIVILGKAWQQQRKVEIQCRQRGIKEEASLEDLPSRVHEILTNL